MRGIERLPSGKYRCTLRRTQGSGRKKAVDSKAGSYDAARAVRDEIERNDRENIEGPGGLTVAQWGRLWLSEITEAKATGRKLLSRKKQKLKKTEKLDLTNIESHLNAHIFKSELADMPVRAVKAVHIKRFLDWLSTRVKQHPGTVKQGDDRPTVGEVLSERTQKRIFTTLCNLFFAAKEDTRKRCRNRIDPTVGLFVLTTEDDHDDIDTWLDDDLPLTRDERATLLHDFGDNPERWIVEFAMGTGLRQGEMWNLELVDLHLDDPEPYVWVRWGSKGLPPKNGQPRKVPLFGIALQAARNWLEALKTYAPINREGLVFPMKERISRRGKLRGGTRRRLSTVPTSFKRLQKARVLGPDRSFHWHALRHTCATALLCGDWGRQWELIEISKLLGHKSLAVTQMYAKFKSGMLFKAAAQQRVAFAEQQSESPSPNPPPVAAPAATPVAPVAPAPATPEKNADGSLLDGLADLVQRAMREQNFGVAQSLLALAGSTAWIPAAPVAAVAPAPQPIPPSPPPVPQPAAPVPQPAPMVALQRPIRKGSANRRARPTVASSGDTEGPRRSSESLTQLIEPLPLTGLHSGSFTPTAGSLDGLTVVAAVKGRTRLEPRTPAIEKGTTRVPSSVEPTASGAHARTLAMSPGLVVFEPVFDPEAGKCPR